MADSDDNRVPEKRQLSFGATIAVTVKEDETSEKVYHIQEDLITARSSFAREQLQKVSCRVPPRGFLVTDCSLEHFELYCHYIYTDQIPCLSESDDEPCFDLEWETLVSLYLLAKKLNDIGAMDASLNALLHTYDEKSSGSPLRRLIVDMYRWGGTASKTDQKDGGLPNRFYADLARALLREKAEESANIPSDVSSCDYHVHDADEVCPSRKRERDDSDDEDEDEDEDEGESHDEERKESELSSKVEGVEKLLTGMQTTLDMLVKTMEPKATSNEDEKEI